MVPVSMIWPLKVEAVDTVACGSRCVGDHPFGVRGDQQLGELGDRVDLGHRDAVVAAEPAALTLHPELGPARAAALTHVSLTWRSEFTTP